MRRLATLLFLGGVMLALGAGIAQAQPTTETITGSTSFTVITNNPCNGEEYVL
jgi:hypothetical protein